MRTIVRKIFEPTPLYHPLRNWVVKRRHSQELQQWEDQGRPVPPPHIVKQRTLRSYSKEYGLRILVETGTYYGDMVEAMKDGFDRIYSIELSKDLYEKARRRFSGTNHIQLIQGDSGRELQKIVQTLDQPALFWLDGHYSAGVTARGEKDTPVFEELTHIFGSGNKGHVIIIDDARGFGTDPAYPTIKELEDFILSKRTNVDILVQDDSIRIAPKSK